MTHDKLFDTKSHIKEKMRGQNVGVEVGMRAATATPKQQLAIT